MRKTRIPASKTSGALATTLSQADALLQAGREQAALQLLQPLAERHPRQAELHALLGSAYEQSKELWNAAVAYEKALALRWKADWQLSLGYIYLDLGLQVLARRALRQALKAGLSPELAAELEKVLRSLENEILGAVFILGLRPDKVEKGLRWMEEGQLALHSQAYHRSIQLNRKAVQLLGDFPPPQNNLSLALFFHGFPQEAIHTARQVAARNPENIQALGNLVRFLEWTGRTEEAQQVWQQLKALNPTDHSSRMKKVESAAIMADSEEVYRLLSQASQDEEARDGMYTLQQQFYLAVAAANTGRLEAARNLFEVLKETDPRAKVLLKALQAGQRGPGMAERFPFFHASELLPQREIQAFIDLAVEADELPTDQYRQKIERFTARFPQLVLVASKFLWEEGQVEAGISMLSTLGTPQAYAVLREFGLGQAGDDETRRKAVFALLEAGQIPQDQPLRLWQDGRWQDVQLHTYRIVNERRLTYPRHIVELLNQGLQAHQQKRYAAAEKIFKRVMTLEPRAKEAFNNLATIYTIQKKHVEARALFEQAIELDPLYALPRCNLAMYLIDEDLAAAEALLTPLESVTEMHVQDIAFLSCVRAQISIARSEFDQAQEFLEAALQVYPDYVLAKNLLDLLKTTKLIRKGWEGIWEKQHQNAVARRERQRRLLQTHDPTLAEAYSIYTREALSAIARLVIPWGGWSAYKKARLHQTLVDYYQEDGVLARVLASLASDERDAFELVLAEGGSMPWDAFAEAFDDDLEESPHWQYHRPETVMGRLRAHGLLVEATIDDQLIISIPRELRG
jgi:Flp pilus assembly protein TadD